MKKRKLFIATLLVVVATSVAVVSCKKDTATSEMPNKKSETAAAFDPSQIDDMNAYLKEFKQKMLSSTRGDNETLSLDAAAWHLSSVANYDFGHANVEYDDVRFDTLYSTVTITNGFILLDDLADAYENISVLIDNFYQNLELENMHFRFIQCKIAEQGEVTISIMTTFSNMDRWHYFSDDDDFCDVHFSDHVQYYANTRAVNVLTNLFNLYLEKETDPNAGRIYYVITRPEEKFHYYDWLEDPDEYSPNFAHSRLYCSLNIYAWPIPKQQMCYYLDSYLGLAVENVTYSGPSVVSGVVSFWDFGDGKDMAEQPCGNHVLTVNYGIGIASNNNQY